MIAAALSAVLLSAAPQLEAAASAGGGYDSNPNHADPSLSSLGSGFMSLRASGGASLDVGERSNVYAGLRFDDEEYPSFPDLTTRTVGGELSLVQELGARTALVLTPWVARSWSGDSGRDATTWAAQLTLRVKPVRELALRAFYAYKDQNASNDVFSSISNRVGASAEWRLLPRTYLSAAASVERGDEVFYRALTTGGTTGGGMGGEMGQGSGGRAADQPYKEEATTWAFGPALEVGLGSGVYLLGSYEVRWIEATTTNLRTQSVFAAVGARR
jgi:hypothetical protein